VASITREAGGRKTIQFVGGDGKRRSIRLGKCSLSAAHAVKAKVAALVSASLTGYALDNETATWAAELSDTMHGKLSAVGLLPKRASATLGPFVDDYVARRVDVKPATKEVWRQGRLGLVGFFGEARVMRDITPGDANGYRMRLVGQGLAPMTIRKRLQFATTIFRAAMRQRLIRENPFEGVSVLATMPDRMRFVTPDETAQILDKCPDIHWQVIASLARWGGLRCPSEVLSQRWQDIDWAAGKIVVTSPKTEHHPGKDCRTIPLFPELRPILERAFDLAPEGAVYVVDERFRRSSMGPAGWRNCNLRTTFEKIVRRAGLTHGPGCGTTYDRPEKRNWPSGFRCTW